MIYRITYDNKNRKLAHPVKNREELMALRDSKENLENLARARQGDARARQGDEKAKADLLQLAYNIGHVEGLIAGCKSQGSFFFHDVDCYDAEQSDAFKELILSKKDVIGLMMLERSASGGWHLICTLTRRICKGWCIRPVDRPKTCLTSMMRCLRSR